MAGFRIVFARVLVVTDHRAAADPPEYAIPRMDDRQGDRGIISSNAIMKCQVQSFPPSCGCSSLAMVNGNDPVYGILHSGAPPGSPAPSSSNPKEPAMSRPPLPPFTEASAIEKVRLAEDGWNSRDPAKVTLAYTEDSRWRNRAEFVTGRAEIQAFLTRKWNKELGYRLIKELWAFAGNRIAVRYAYEYHDDSGQWFRAYGNENWEFAEDGLMRARHASINEHPIAETERKFHWPLGRRPDDHPGLSHFGF
jgi:nuclear transport factor 2 (NTF2) superfamily protein